MSFCHYCQFVHFFHVGQYCISHHYCHHIHHYHYYFMANITGTVSIIVIVGVSMVFFVIVPISVVFSKFVHLSYLFVIKLINNRINFELKPTVSPRKRHIYIVILFWVRLFYAVVNTFSPSPLTHTYVMLEVVGLLLLMCNMKVMMSLIHM